MPLNDIVGHSFSIDILRRSHKAGRLHHAHIFSGPDGIGKRLTALSLAKMLNCQEMEDDFCGRCVSCRKIDGGSHPDVRTVSPDGQFIKIDQVREVQRELQYRPFEGRKRVFIIDDADRMGLPAANSLLKTLEEPPKDSILILVTSNFHALIPTIVSRCQRMVFSSLPISAVRELLIKKGGMDGEKAGVIASVSEGSPGRALGEGGSSLLEEREGALRILTGLKEREVISIFGLSEELAKDESLEIKLASLKTLYRDMAAAKAGGGGLVNCDMTAELENESLGRNMDDLIDGFEVISETEGLIKRNINKQLALEVMMIRLAGI